MAAVKYEYVIAYVIPGGFWSRGELKLEDESVVLDSSGYENEKEMRETADSILEGIHVEMKQFEYRFIKSTTQSDE